MNQRQARGRELSILIEAPLSASTWIGGKPRGNMNTVASETRSEWTEGRARVCAQPFNGKRGGAVLGCLVKGVKEPFETA